MKYQGITIHKTPGYNSWYTRYRANGSQHFISGKTQKQVLEKLKKALRLAQIEKLKLLTAPPVEQQSPTLAEWYKKWLDLYKYGKVKDSTLEDYEKIYKNINSKILETQIDKLNSIEILENLNSISAERVRQKVYDLLSMLLEKAKINELVSKNIMERIDKPKHIKENSQPLTHEQEKEFIIACKKVRHGDYFLVCLYQGLRRGEGLALTIQDVDLKNNTLSITKSINIKNQLDTTKNVQSNRVMPLFDRSKAIFSKYTEAPGRIFDISSKIIQKALSEINKQMTHHVKIKDLRSTFITRCQEENIPEFVTQAWVGHSIGSKVTKSVYTKYNPQDNSKYINILNESKLYSNSTQEK